MSCAVVLADAALNSGYPEDRVDGRSTALGFYFQSTAELPQSVSHAAEA